MGLIYGTSCGDLYEKQITIDLNKILYKGLQNVSDDAKPLHL